MKKKIVTKTFKILPEQGAASAFINCQEKGLKLLSFKRKGTVVTAKYVEDDEK
jgi:hypothetical protein